MEGCDLAMDRLTARLESRSLVKFILGLTNFDMAEIRFLTHVYTLAGADIIDVPADPGVVMASRGAMEEIRDQVPDMGELPSLMVSVALKHDPQSPWIPHSRRRSCPPQPSSSQTTWKRA
jgi:hypothetical protein